MMKSSSRSCLLAPLPSSRLPPRLPCRGAGRKACSFLLRCPCPVVLASSRSRSAAPCVLLLSSSCLSHGWAMDIAARLAFPLRRSLVLVLVPRADAWRCCSRLVLPPVSRVVGRGGICVGVVDCPFCIYNLPVSWYLIGVERETSTDRKDLPK